MGSKLCSTLIETREAGRTESPCHSSRRLTRIRGEPPGWQAAARRDGSAA
jgi:hypothetical protein